MLCNGVLVVTRDGCKVSYFFYCNNSLSSSARQSDWWIGKPSIRWRDRLWFVQGHKSGNSMTGKKWCRSVLLGWQSNVPRSRSVSETNVNWQEAGKILLNNLIWILSLFFCNTPTYFNTVIVLIWLGQPMTISSLNRGGEKPDCKYFSIDIFADCNFL